MAQALRWLVNLIVAVVLTAGGALSPALAGARHYPGPRHHRAVPAHRSVAHRVVLSANYNKWLSALPRRHAAGCTMPAILAVSVPC